MREGEGIEGIAKCPLFLSAVAPPANGIGARTIVSTSDNEAIIIAIF